MQARQSHSWSYSRLIFLSVVSLLLLISAAGVLVLLPDRIAVHLQDRIADEISVEIASTQVSYSLFNSELVFQDVDFQLGEGMNVSTDETRLKVALSDLWKDELTLSQISFQSPAIQVDLDQVGRQGAGDSGITALLEKSPHLIFNEGRLTFKGSAQKLPLVTPLAVTFQEIQLDTSAESQLGITLNGQSGEAEWRYSGTLDIETLSLTGNLGLTHLPLATAGNLLPFHSAFVEVKEGAEIAAELALDWNADEGVKLTGNLSSSEGSLKTAEGIEMGWQSLAIPEFQYLNGEVTISQISLKQADILLPEQGLPAALTPFGQGSAIHYSEILLEDSQLRFSDKGSESHLSSINGSLTGNSSERKKFSVTAQWHGIPVSLGGEIIEEGSLFTGKARNVEVSKLSRSLRTIGGYDLSGSLFDTTFVVQWPRSGVSLNGNILITRLKNQPVSDQPINLPYVAALMTDGRGQMDIPLSLKNSKPGAFAADAVKDIERYWAGLVAEPLAYLSREAANGQKLSLDVQMIPGAGQWPPSSIARMEAWGRVLEQRPGLNLSVRGTASRTADLPVLAKAELDRNLEELYRAISNKSPSDGSYVAIPAEVRDQLVEQMYLRTRKRKLPEIGDETREQRVQHAETWLLENWPLKPDLLDNLARKRGEAVHLFMLEEGVDDSRVSIEPALVDEGQARVSLQILNR